MAEKISAEEWRETHRDFKSIINGKRHIMRFKEGVGSHMVEVEVERVKKAIRNLK